MLLSFWNWQFSFLVKLISFCSLSSTIPIISHSKLKYPPEPFWYILHISTRTFQSSLHSVQSILYSAQSINRDYLNECSKVEPKPISPECCHIGLLSACPAESLLCSPEWQPGAVGQQDTWRQDGIGSLMLPFTPVLVL